MAEVKSSVSTSSPCPGAKTKGVTRPLPPAGASSHPFPDLRFHRELQDQAGTVLGLGWKVDTEPSHTEPKRTQAISTKDGQRATGEGPQSTAID